ncbi:hypothetical protein ACQY0O_002410 [Thecaphora frezii]
MRLIVLFAALVGCVLADYPNPTVFRLKDFDINIYPSKVCVSGIPYKFSFKNKKDSPDFNLLCSTKGSPDDVVGCQTNEDPHCTQCHFNSLEATSHSQLARENAYCIKTKDYHIDPSNSHKKAAVQKYVSDAIGGKLIVVWEPKEKASKTTYQIPNTPYPNTEVKTYTKTR